MLKTAGKKLKDNYVAAGYPLLPLTRWLRGPLRWYYHRSPLLRHDSLAHWKPRLLSAAHELFVREHPPDFLIHGGRIKFRSIGSLMSMHGYYVGAIEHHLVQFVVSRLRSGFVMFDVGAHHGAFTVVAAFELKSRGWDGLIHAFEPDPGNFALLEFNIRQNALEHYVVLHPEAVGESQSQGKMVVDSRDNSAGFLERVHSAAELASLGIAERREVSITTLDSLLNSVPSVDFVKIDVQNAEHLVLAGGESIIERSRPIIAVEAVEGWPNTERIREFLLRHRYTIHGVDEAGQLCAPGSPEAFVSWDWVAIP